MERLISFDGGRIRLPVGYRFRPTDEDLVNFYLRKKVFKQPFTVEIIPEFDVFQTEPWGLPAGGRLFKDQRFFFFNTKGHVFENIDKRAAGSGYWKITARDAEIVVSGSDKLIGKRNTLIFYEGKGTRVVKTSWVMHEFRLVRLATASNPSQTANWAVYRIFQMKKKSKKGKKAKGSKGEASDSSQDERPEAEDIKPSVIDFTVEGGSSSGPPSPCTP